MSATSLYATFQQMDDPRSALGRRHPLPAILSLMTVAMLGGCRSLEAIAQFGRDRGEGLAEALGFSRRRTPCKATLHYVLKALDVATMEQLLAQWLEHKQRKGWRKLALDGKTLRGATGEQLPGVHLVAAFAHEAKGVIGQLRVDAKTNEHKAALELLDVIDVQGRALTGDAAFCQRDLSRKVRKKKGTTSGR